MRCALLTSCPFPPMSIQSSFALTSAGSLGFLILNSCWSNNSGCSDPVKTIIAHWFSFGIEIHVNEHISTVHITTITFILVCGVSTEITTLDDIFLVYATAFQKCIVLLFLVNFNLSTLSFWTDVSEPVRKSELVWTSIPLLLLVSATETICKYFETIFSFQWFY